MLRRRCSDKCRGRKEVGGDAYVRLQRTELAHGESVSACEIVGLTVCASTLAIAAHVVDEPRLQSEAEQSETVGGVGVEAEEPFLWRNAVRLCHGGGVFRARSGCCGTVGSCGIAAFAASARQHKGYAGDARHNKKKSDHEAVGMAEIEYFLQEHRLQFYRFVFIQAGHDGRYAGGRARASATSLLDAFVISHRTGAGISVLCLRDRRNARRRDRLRRTWNAACPSR